MKTITIDLEAYEILRRRKKPGQSFSDVIKEHFSERATGRVLLAALSEIRFDPSTLDAADDLVGGRSRDQAAAPEP